jgi:excisionase family DNA binding protein
MANLQDRTTKAEENLPGGEQADVLQDGFVPVGAAAKFLGISRAKVYQLMDSGDILYAKFGKSRRIPLRALHRYAQNCLVGPAA